MDPVFGIFCDEVVDAVLGTNPKPGQNVNPWPEQFANCATDFDRVRVLMSIPQLKAFSLERVSHKQRFLSGNKSNVESTRLLARGSELLSRGDTQGALSLFTKSLFFAIGPNQKALVIAHRARVLAAIGAYSEAARDIDYAIQNDCPPDLHFELLLCRAQCLLKLGKFSEAKLDFLQARQRLCAASIESANELITKGLMCCTKPPDGVQETLPFLSVYPSGIAGSPVSETAKFEGNYRIVDGGKTGGWHVVAAKKFEPGDLILVDKPYGCRIRRDYFTTHCYTCLRRAVNLLPCRSCAEIGFCCSTCEEQAWSSTSNHQSMGMQHRFECGQLSRLLLDDYAGWKAYRGRLRDPPLTPESWADFAQYLDSLPTNDAIGGQSISFLAFGCVADTPPDALIKLIEQCYRVPSSGDGSAAVSLLAFTGQRQQPDAGAIDFTSVGWLATNSDKRTTHDLWQRTVAAVFLTHCLSAGGYPLDWDSRCFHNPETDGPLSTDPGTALPASWAAALILNLLQSISTNAHAFTTQSYAQDEAFNHRLPSTGIDLERLTLNEVASCLYPTISLLNHSCNPNVLEISLQAGARAVFALQPIPEGQALLSNYGFHYAVNSAPERLQGLREQYLFECQCVACVENWKMATAWDCMACIQCRQLSNDCTCSIAVKDISQSAYHLSNVQFMSTVATIPQAYLKLTFHQLSAGLVDKHIAQIRSYLTEGLIERVLRRPSSSLDFSQELLKLLLDVRYGWLEVFNPVPSKLSVQGK